MNQSSNTSDQSSAINDVGITSSVRSDTSHSPRADDRHRLHHVPSPHGRIAVHEYAGSGAPLVLLHGFPDDSRIYDRLIPHLSGRHVVALDFVGYGASERKETSVISSGQRASEVMTVLDALQLDSATVVGHDSGGPVAVDVALDSARVGKLVLLNSYYGRETELRLPEMIQLFGDPRLAPLADAIIDDAGQRAWLLGHTARRFGYDPDAPDSVRSRAIIPQFFGDTGQEHARNAIRAWTRALPRDLTEQTQRVKNGDLHRLSVPVTLAFGADDNYLSPRLAVQIAAHFKSPRLHLIDGASHWPQWDRPEDVAKLL